jgi:hypothetical protein
VADEEPRTHPQTRLACKSSGFRVNATALIPVDCAIVKWGEKPQSGKHAFGDATMRERVM